jgi:hypothetical protein
MVMSIVVIQIADYEKAMKRVVKDQKSAFIGENIILIEQQSGFRKSHSCETSFNLVLTQWKEEIDKKVKL